MKAINKTAQKTFEKVIDGLNEPGDAKKIDNSSAFMKVSVDFLFTTEAGKVFAVAHNYIQNDDVIADPDMTFLVSSVDSRVYPLTFQTGDFYQIGAEITDSGFKVAPRAQREQATFAGTWMKNIKAQQRI